MILKWAITTKHEKKIPTLFLFKSIVQAIYFKMHWINERKNKYTIVEAFKS
jgi:hypothetical protein